MGERWKFPEDQIAIKRACSGYGLTKGDKKGRLPLRGGVVAHCSCNGCYPLACSRAVIHQVVCKTVDDLSGLSIFTRRRAADALWKEAQADEDGDAQTPEAPAPRSSQEEEVTGTRQSQTASSSTPVTYGKTRRHWRARLVEERSLTHGDNRGTSLSGDTSG